MSAARKRGLGRGLDALLGGSTPDPGADGRGAAKQPQGKRGSASPVDVSELAVDDIRPNPKQPRTRFADGDLDSLADSVRAQGLIQPIVVTRESGGWMILAGERRWRAARRAGLETVPVAVRENVSEQQRLELALVENLQRSDLDPIEEAEAYRTLREEFGLSQEEVAKSVGKARSTVTNALRLLRLPEEVRDMLAAGRLSAGQARPLLALKSASQQRELAREAVENSLSARDIERRVGGGTEAPRPKKKAEPKADVHARAAEERLTQALQTKVQIYRRGAGGQVRLHFHSEEELMRLYEALVR